MVEREKFDIEVEGNWLIAGVKKDGLKLSFSFNAEPNVSERIRIKNEAAELLGGVEKIIHLENLAFSFYEKHIQFNKEKYGEEQFVVKVADLEKLAEPKTEEEITVYNKLYKEIYKNPQYDMYVGLIEDRVKIGEYAFLKVMNINKPEGFEFFKQKEVELKKIVDMVNERRKFFRNQVEATKAAIIS